MELLRNSLEPTRRESPKAYRGGEVEVLTFDTEDYHLCYGVAKDGSVFDFCLMSDTMVHMEGKLDEAELQKAQKAIDGL